MKSWAFTGLSSTGAFSAFLNRSLAAPFTDAALFSLSLLLTGATPSSQTCVSFSGVAPDCAPSAADAAFSRTGITLSSAFPENLLTAFRFAFGGCPSLSLSSSPRVK